MPSDAFVLFVAGRHVQKKGFDVAIKAVARSSPNIHLIVGGLGPETEGLVRLAASLGVLNRVHFVGVVEHERMPEYFAASDACLFPSRDTFDNRLGAMDYESMGRFACEAAASARPTIATKTAGIPEVVHDGQTGILVPADDVEAYQQAIQKLAGSPELIWSMGNNARAWAVSALSFDAVAVQTLNVIDGAVAGWQHLRPLTQGT